MSYKEECFKRLEYTNKYSKYSQEDLIDEIIEKDKEIERLKKELEIEQDISEGMLETINKAIEYIQDKYAVILADDLFLDHDERIERKRIEHILEILDKGGKQ